MEGSDTPLMAIERVRVTVDARRIDELCDAFRSLIGPGRAERGCLRCEVFCGLPEANTVLVESLWKTQEDLIQHLRSDRYKSFLQLVETSIEQPSIEFFLVAQVSDLEMVTEVRNSRM